MSQKGAALGMLCSVKCISVCAQRVFLQTDGYVCSECTVNNAWVCRACAVGRVMKQAASRKPASWDLGSQQKDRIVEITVPLAFRPQRVYSHAKHVLQLHALHRWQLNWPLLQCWPWGGARGKAKQFAHQKIVSFIPVTFHTLERKNWA